MKISKKYWSTLNEFEREYIRQRAEIDGIANLKLKINEARIQQPNFNKIYGKGFIELPDGKTFLWSGEDTRKYQQI